MPAVFVHGNPESSAIWNLLIPELDRQDVVLLSPPGFGASYARRLDSNARSVR